LSLLFDGDEGERARETNADPYREFGKVRHSRTIVFLAGKLIHVLKRFNERDVLTNCNYILT
jgi:hypothetical protein